MKNGYYKSIRRLTLGAMLAAMSVVIGIFCKNFMDFGGVFRITFENLPIIISGLLFGPVWGGTVGVLSDLISYLLSAQAYPPNLVVTLGAMAVGVISGVVSRYVIKERSRLQIIVAGGLAHLVGSMIIKPIGIFTFYGWAVLWRIPIYLVIAPIEIFLICLLFRNNGFRRLAGELEGD